jgi:hypothetical protein
MVEAALRDNADIVGGPVHPVFPPGTPGLYRQYTGYWSVHEGHGRVPMIYGSGNCLIRRRVFERLPDPEFDLRFNFLGGGDTEFFRRGRDAGLVTVWEPKALILETVQPARLHIRWMLFRGIRTGVINYNIDRLHAESAEQRLRLAVKNIAWLPLGLWRGHRLAVKNIAWLPLGLWRGLGEHIRTGNPLRAVYPVTVALGRILAATGFQPQPYRDVKA